ncbi:MAG: hypothetical protein CME24_20435 [Gemmatimonadetes bacterium]|nr:hypothetical protein [Gemmatimonadota bacterium]
MGTETCLTPEQIRHFRHNGYLKLPTLLPAERVEQLRRAVTQDVKDAVDPVVRDSDDRVVRLSKLLDRDPIFRQSVTDDRVLELLSGLLGPHIEMVHNRHNHATLNLAHRNTDHFHRDVVQWSRSIVTIIFYLEETHLDNGCTQLIPGTHLLPGVDVLHRIDENEWVAAAKLGGQAIPVPMPAGGMLAIDSLVFHRAGPNQTDDTRMSMTIGYRSVDELASVDDPTTELVLGRRGYMGNDGRSRNDGDERTTR